MPHVFSILYGAAFTVAVMWALGRLLFRRLGVSLYAVEQDLLAVVTGGVLLSLSVFILCTINAARTPVFLLFGIAVLALQWHFRAATSAGPLPPLPPLWKLLFAVPFAVYAALYLSNSLAPEASPDGQAYHLGLVYGYFREHGFHRMTSNMYGNLPLGMEMLFLFAFSFGRHSAAATVHCCYLLMLPLLMLSYTRRIGKSRAGVCAAMIVYLSPVVGIDGVSAYNDVALATTAFALFYTIEIWREKTETNDRLLIPIGLLAGFCVALKLTGFVAPLYAATVIGMRKRPQALVPFSAAAALIVMPWLIKDWLWLGNPVSPFYNGVFPNPYIHVQFEKDYRAYFRHYELTGFRQWFWSVTTGGETGGQIGPLFLLAPLALLALRWQAGRRCLLAAAFFLIPYPENIGARFLIPALPFIALALVLVFEFSQAALALLMGGAAVLGWPAIVEKYKAPAGSFHIVEMPWKAALRIVPQDVFLRDHSAAWVIAQTLDYFVPKGKRVWSSAPVGEAYCSSDVMISFQSAEGELIEDILTTAVFDNQAPTLNLRFTFPKRRLRHLRISQTATSTEDIWSIGEVSVFNGPDQIPRRPEWNLNATPYPWDITLAFDGNPVTRWKSWESIHPGMHVDVDFGASVELDRVELHSSHDQGRIEVQLDMPSRLEKVEDPQPGDLRRLATQTVKARGVDYLLIDDPYRIAADISRDPARWGLQFIADRAGTRLYRIQ